MTQKKCSAKDCVSSVAQNVVVAMFKFPRDLERCALWVKNAGNEKLLQSPSRSLCIKRYLCGNHFEENQFFDKFHRRLRRKAVPTIFNCVPLSEELMTKFPVLDNETSCNQKLKSVKNDTVMPLELNQLQRNFSVGLNVDYVSLDDPRKLEDCGINLIEETDHQPEFQKTCGPSSSDLDSVIPGSITYIEGPWSNPTEDDETPLSIQVFESPDVELSSEIMIGAKCEVQHSDQLFAEALNADYLKENLNQSSECSSYLSSSFSDIYDNSKASQNSDFSAADCSQVPSDIEKFLSSSTTEKHFVLQSKLLTNGAHVRVIYSVPNAIKK